jgi:hypothetical protein
MPDRMSQTVKASACNDNGLAAVLGGRAVAPKGVLTAAARACEMVLLNYIARGSMIVMRADGRVIATAA